MDPAMAYSDDKLAIIAGGRRLLMARDKTAALEEMGYGAVLGEERFPESHEFLEAIESGPGGINALFERYGLKDLCRNSSVSPESIREEASGYVKSIFKNTRFLGDVLDRHEATVHRRWLKKSDRLRLKIILEAWGGKMAASHRPDFEAIEVEDEEQRTERTAYRDSYLWPYINKEDICKPNSLLLLTSTRSRCHPSALAATEHEAHSLGNRLLVFGFRDPGRYLLDLTSDGDEDCYGKLWSQHTHPDKYATLSQRPFTTSQDGLLVLEAQERVLSFLVNCAKLLLHDITEEFMLLSPPVQFVSTLTTKTDAGYISQDRIASLLTAKYDEAADHLFSLREDPSYFEAHMLESKEHRREVILDPFRRHHPVCSPEREDQFWARVVADQVCQAHLKLEVFANLMSQSEHLRDLQNTYADVLNTATDFPELYTDCLLQFRFDLCDAAQILGQELWQAWYASPPVRQFYRRKVETDPAAQVNELQALPSLNDDPTRARIAYLITRLRVADELFEVLGLTNIVDELQRLIDSKPAEHCVSPRIALLVGELALVCALFRQLELYKPWVDMHGEVSKTKFKHMEAVHMIRLKPVLDLYLGIDQRDCTLGALGAPLRGKFTFPADRRRTRAKVEAMRRAEEKLDDFWRKVDEDIKSKAAEFCDNVHQRLDLQDCDDANSKVDPLKHSAAYRLLTQGRALQRTPPWVEPEREDDQKTATELYIPFSQLFSEDQKTHEQISSKGPGQSAKEKTKTRKPSSPKPAKAEAEAETATPTAKGRSRPHFALDARALKVFKTLFFTPSVTSTPGTLAWTDFLYAMASVGLTPEKLSGSAWRFSPDPDKLNVERSINFHEPHGAETKILYHIARRNGRRLNRAYGWDGACFTFEEKLK